MRIECHCRGARTDPDLSALPSALPSQFNLGHDSAEGQRDVFTPAAREQRWY